MSFRTLFEDEMHNLLSSDDPYFGDIPVSVTYTQQPLTGDLDWDTGLVDEGSNVAHSVKGIIGPFTKQQLSHFDIAPNDVAFRFSTKGVSFTPTLQDEVTYNSVTYKVVDKRLSTTGSVWTLQLRS